MDILLQGCYAALNGNLSYEGSNVPVYDEKKKKGHASDLFVILSTQQESPTDATTDCAFVNLSSIDIEITHKTEFEVSKSVLNNIANQILQILIPYPWESGLAPVSGVDVLHMRMERSITRAFDITETQSVLVKIITISCEIVQQNA